MNRKIYVFTLLVAMFCAACDKSDIAYENSFENSYQTWLNFKQSSNNTYRYVVTGGTWAGASWQTTLTVKNGQVTQRDFQYTVFNDIRMPSQGWSEQSVQEILDSLQARGYEYSLSAQELVATLSWTEEGQDIGSHDSSPAATNRNLDEVYEKARKEWLQKREDADTYFEAKNNGLISSCGYVVEGCQDDCFNGITISSIKALE